MAGQNKKAVQRRMRAVRNIRQITKAMKMVAAAKLRRAQEKVIQARPYARELRKVLARLVAAGGIDHPLLQPRPARKVAYVVISADRGLAGSYNVNLIRKAQAAVREEEREYGLVFVGRKARDFFRRRNYPLLKDYTGIGEEPSFATCRSIIQAVTDQFVKGEVDEVRLVYTEFVNAISQRPQEIQLLPIPPATEAEAEGGPEMNYIFEPSVQAVLNTIVPKMVETTFYQAILEAKASEYGARMTAMGSATDNANELLGKLTLAYNRARQAGITKEISEIVGGAEALKA